MIERRRADTNALRRSVAKHVGDAGLRVVGECRDAIAHGRHRERHALERLERHLLPGRRILAGENQSQSLPAEVAGDQHVRPIRRRLPRRVPAPTRDDEIHLPVAVEVAGGQSVPSAGAVRQTPVARHVAQPATVVVQHADRSPLGGRDELGPPVAIEIREDRLRHEAEGRQRARVRGVERPAAVGVAQIESRWRGQGPRPRHHARSDEEIESAVAVHVGEGQGTDARAVARQYL